MLGQEDGRHNYSILMNYGGKMSSESQVGPMCYRSGRKEEQNCCYGDINGVAIHDEALLAKSKTYKCE